MYFLDGERFYIKPESGYKSLESQLHNCFIQIGNIISGKRVFKLNFFVDVKSSDGYLELQQYIRVNVFEFFPTRIILNIIAQPPLTSKIILEVFCYNPKFWKTEFIFTQFGESVLFSREKTKFLIGNVQSNCSGDRGVQSEKAFKLLNEIFDLKGFKMGSIIRQWNYIEDITGYSNDKQNYQEFNNIRSSFYKDFFESEGYPAATGIGMNKGGVIIEFIALDSDVAITKPIDNPKQIAAHCYSKNVLDGDDCELKNTPKFERARYLEIFGKKIIFISGTASIVGENTKGLNNPAEQTRITIQNIQQLYSVEVLKQILKERIEPKYGHARIYIKRRVDYTAIRRMVNLYYGNLPAVYILADICRKDLLVEIEGKVILE